MVELSIVLVILGLLTGGILGGQTLMRAAELRSIPKDFEKYNASLYAFQDKYFALPGDMPNAVRFWGAAAGGTADGEDAACVALDYTSPSIGTETCNGDGNGRVEPNEEMMRFWQHLANAGMIEGHYTGVSENNVTNRAHQPGLNCPASKVGNGGFSFWDIVDRAPGHNYYYPGEYSHAFQFGQGPSNYGLISAILTPEEAWNLDTKMDDGMPATGKIRPRSPGPNGHADCATSTDPTVATYKLDHEAIACGLHFITGL